MDMPIMVNVSIDKKRGLPHMAILFVSGNHISSLRFTDMFMVIK